MVSSRIEPLNRLRVSAALLVFGSHVAWSAESYRNFFSQGFVGVSIFFILSGFVMSFAYCDRISSRSISFKVFLALRLARLAPVYWAVGLVSLVALPLVKSETPQFRAIDLFYFVFLQSWLPHPGIYFSVYSPGWSVANELFFYLIFFPVVLFAGTRIRFIFTILLALVIGSAVVTTFFPSEFAPIWAPNPSHYLFYIFPVFRGLEFITGILLYRLWKSGVRFRFLKPSFVYLVLAIMMIFGPQVPEAFRMSLFYLPVAALLVYAHAQSNGDVLSNPFAALLRELGNASYSFYMIHFLIIQHVAFDLAVIGVNNLLLLVITFLCAVTIHRSFERPLHHHLVKKYKA